MPEKAAPAQWTTVVWPRKDDETGTGDAWQEGVADVGSWYLRDVNVVRRARSDDESADEEPTPGR